MKPSVPQAATFKHLLWTDEILTLKPWETIVCWYLQGNRIIPLGCLGGAKWISSIHRRTDTGTRLVDVLHLLSVVGHPREVNQRQLRPRRAHHAHEKGLARV